MNKIKSALGVASVTGVLLTGSLFASTPAKAAIIACSTINTLADFQAATDGCQDQDKLYKYIDSENLDPLAGIDINFTPDAGAPGRDIHTLSYNPVDSLTDIEVSLWYSISITDPMQAFDIAQFDVDNFGDYTGTKLVEWDDESFELEEGEVGTFPGLVQNILVHDTLDIPEGTTVDSFTNRFIEKRATPEPTSLLGLLAVGGLGLGLLRKKQS